ncbi:MAG: hypothetical protein K0Q55_4171 [Verrucomicrobia bacterium]|jgi:hypothetical protein|nr:hypothetical protein [Verrucomicrobiota bacterium]
MQGALKCPKCKVDLGSLNTVGETIMLCPRCLKEIQVIAFPALYRRISPAATSSGEAALEGDSTCFYHPQKKAAQVCDSCGRFLCALCDVELEQQHLCPSCLESGARKKNIQSLERTRQLNGRTAFVLSIIPCLITGPVAVFMAIKYWNAPGSVVSKSRWHTRAALVFGLIQTGFLVLVIISIFAAA